MVASVSESVNEDEAMKRILCHVAVVLGITACSMTGGWAEEPKSFKIQASILTVSRATTENLVAIKDTKQEKVQSVKTDDLKAWLVNAQNDRSTQIISAPSLVLNDNQEGFFQVGEPTMLQTGLEIQFVDGTEKIVVKTENIHKGVTFRTTPKIVDDNKTLLKVSFQQISVVNQPAREVKIKSLDQPNATTKVVTLQAPKITKQGAEGSSELAAHQSFVMVIPGSSATAQKVEYSLPGFSQVPYLNRLFKTQGIILTPPTDTVVIVSLVPIASVAPTK
jgi:type II secretory pathway component GspD/PulD (secretin)